MKPFCFAFITQDDPIYVRIFFDEFFRSYKDRDAIRAVVIAPAMGKKSIGALAKQMYDFYGPIDFLRVGTRYAIGKGLARLPRWLRGNKSFSLAQLCEDQGIPVVQARNVNAPEFLDLAKTWDLSLVISVAAPQIFREHLINLPSQGCINIHNSPLPKYRGMLPNFWQMYHGEREVGTTVHRINAGIDDGDIILQKFSPIESGESLDSLIRRTKKLGARFMADAIELVRTGKATAIPNRKEDATYFSFPKPDDVREFRRRGYRLL